MDWDKRLLPGVGTGSTKEQVERVIFKGGAAWSTWRNLLAEVHGKVHMFIFEVRECY